MYFVTHIFLKNEVHTNIGGGRDNIIRDNVFYNATLNAMQVDHRGTAHSVDTTLYDKLRVRYFISVETSCVILMLNWKIVIQLANLFDVQKVPFKTGIWASKYPKLAVIESNSPSEPRGKSVFSWDDKNETIRNNPRKNQYNL